MIASKGNIRRIYQVLPNFSKRDAIGTDVLMIDQYFKRQGIPSGIFFDESGPENLSQHVSQMIDHYMQETLIIYHFSVASRLSYFLSSLPSRIWTRYHNITPAYFFNERGENGAREACIAGRSQIPFVSGISEVVIADSDYNGDEMRPFTSCPIHTLPIFRDYQALTKLPDSRDFLSQLKSMTDPILLFVGRIAPNKCQHDIIQLAYLYRKTTGKKVRVILAGTFFSHDYRKSLTAFAQSLSMVVTEALHPDADIMVLGSISDDELATLYRHSNAFVSMSEHEGFGVPLVESLWFDLPVIAHDSSAVGETLGDAGWLVTKNDWIGVINALHSVLSEDIGNGMRQKVALRREKLSTSSAEKTLEKILKDHIL